MKKIENDILLFYGLMTSLHKEEKIRAHEYIEDYDGDMVAKWFEKYFPEDDPEKCKNLMIELARKHYGEIKNKK